MWIGALRLLGELANLIDGVCGMPRALKEEEGKRYSLSARTTLELNQALKDAAKNNGRSVSQEIEFRLEQSFVAENARADEREKNVMRPLDVQSEQLFRSIQIAAGAAMTHMRASWVDDVYARAAVKEAIVGAFRSYTSSHKIIVPQPHFDFGRLQNSARVGAAFGRLHGDLSGAPGGDELLQEVRDLLTPAAPTLVEATAPEDLRRDAALSDLNVGLAA